MVDFIKGVTSIQNVLSGNKASSSPVKDEKLVDKKQHTAPVDEVQISPEALSLAEAEAAASQTRTILEQQTEEALSSGGNALDALL